MPGGYNWLLHYLMYGAPQLAPLALALTGVLAVVAAKGLANGLVFASVSLRSALLILVAIALSGATLQATILHYRGGDSKPEAIMVPSPGWLYAYEADAFAAALHAGLPDVPAMSTDDSLGNMAVLDAWRACATA